MEPEDVRKNLIKELNGKYNKPKLFEPVKLGDENKGFEISPVIGMGFKDSVSNGASFANGREQEIYNMKEFINSNPEDMKTFYYDVKTVKTQYALVKRKEWQDILFGDVDWFKPINFGKGFKDWFR